MNEIATLWTPQMVFTIITTGALYKSVEKLLELLCEKYFKKPIPKQFCLVCFVAAYFVASALITGIVKIGS